MTTETKRILILDFLGVHGPLYLRQLERKFATYADANDIQSKKFPSEKQGFFNLAPILKTMVADGVLRAEAINVRHGAPRKVYSVA